MVGHVDHGKTTLLDYIRKANVASKEAGGITQAVGAYEVTHSRTDSDQDADLRGQKITFIDTPGHEAFSKMRRRGAHIADIAILVVAANDGVQQQTKEAIKILNETQTPFIVAINKIDQQGADVTKVKNELIQAGVFLEGYGGSISWHGVSAKTGEGVNDLLDLILLAADVEGLEYDPEHKAVGYVLESKMDTRKGVMATVIIKDGTLRVGDHISAGTARGKVKILNDFKGARVDSLAASNPAVVFGFEVLPKVGSEFMAGAEAATSQGEAVKAAVTPKAAEGIRSLILILKADVGGSLEALSGIIRSLPTPPDMRIEIPVESVGEVTDGDVKDAISHRAAIIAFRVPSNKAAENLARSQSVAIVQSEIIYDLTKAVQEMIKAGTVAKIIGKLEVLAIFGKKGSPRDSALAKQIVGGKVIEGEIRNSATLDVVHREAVVGKGRIINLQSNKKDAPRVESGNECGMLFDSEIEVKPGDMLILRS